MIGMNASTGRSIADNAHLVQSIGDIISTPIGTRVMRREYGCQIADLIDWPLNSATRLQAYAAIATAVMRWETRIRLSQITLSLGESPGEAYLDITGTLIDTNQSTGLRVPLTMGATA